MMSKEDLSKPIEMPFFQSVPLDETDILDPSMESNHMARNDAAASNVHPLPLSTVPSPPTAADSMKEVELQSDIEAPVPCPPSRKAAAPAEEGKKDTSPPKAQKDRFVGANGLQYVLWGHYLAYGSAMMCLLMGVFAVAFTYATTYGCKIDGVSVHPKYLLPS